MTKSIPNTTLIRRSLYFAVPLIAATALGLTLLRPSPAATNPPPPVVTVATPLVREVREWDEYVGRFVASQSVGIRPRVSGAVTAIHFQDGQVVKAGQLLFTIDPRPYIAALAEARAGAAAAQSALELARSDFARASRLTGDDAVAASELDALRAKVRTAQAALEGARARTRARELDVNFTEVAAPISGRISDRRVDIGNLVVGGEGTAATLLTTINTLDPIYFSFDASESLYLKSKRHGTATASAVEIRLQDEADYRWKGRLDFTDNQIDPRSGTIRGRATLLNPEQLLTPGMFGHMRMTSGSGAALLIPDSAIQNDQAERSVLIVAENGVVALRTVKLGPAVDGLRIITAGLKPTDHIIIGGAMSANPGAKVTARTGEVRARPVAMADSATPPASEATFAAN